MENKEIKKVLVDIKKELEKRLTDYPSNALTVYHKHYGMIKEMLEYY